MIEFLSAYGSWLLTALSTVVALVAPSLFRWRWFFAIGSICLGFFVAYANQVSAERQKTASEARTDRFRAEVSGGNNFPIFTTAWSGGRRLQIWNRKYTPLFDVNFLIKWFPQSADEKAAMQSIDHPILVRSVPTIQAGVVDAGVLVSPGLYTIETSARNGIFYEWLKVEERNGQMSEEWLVILDNKIDGDQHLLDCSPKPHCERTFELMSGKEDTAAVVQPIPDFYQPPY